jgi:hypothetical protein
LSQASQFGAHALAVTLGDAGAGAAWALVTTKLLA